MSPRRLKPLSRFVLLVDDPVEAVENGVVVRLPESGWRTHMDYTVAAVGVRENPDFGVGDRVVLSSPNAGRALRLDRTLYRLVRVSDVIGVCE